MEWSHPLTFMNMDRESDLVTNSGRKHCCWPFFILYKKNGFACVQSPGRPALSKSIRFLEGRILCKPASYNARQPLLRQAVHSPATSLGRMYNCLQISKQPITWQQLSPFRHADVSKMTRWSPNWTSECGRKGDWSDFECGEGGCWWSDGLLVWVTHKLLLIDWEFHHITPTSGVS